MITSCDNSKIKSTLNLIKKSKTRYEEGVFVVEGPKMVLEADKSSIRDLFVSESYSIREEKLLASLDVDYEIISDTLMNKLSDTKTPQGIMAIVNMPKYDIEDFVDESSLVIFIEDIRDPGNLGTIFRTAEGAGVNGIIMSRQTVDIYNPKTIRSTMGSIYRMPFVVADIDTSIEFAKSRGVTVYAAHLGGEMYYDEADYSVGAGFIIGNESKGITDETAALATNLIKIPMCGKLESLNASVAASILMYEAMRQRRN